jgi:hypothetical protein
MFAMMSRASTTRRRRRCRCRVVAVAVVAAAAVVIVVVVVVAVIVFISFCVCLAAAARCWQAACLDARRRARFSWRRGAPRRPDRLAATTTAGRPAGDQIQGVSMRRQGRKFASNTNDNKHEQQNGQQPACLGPAPPPLLDLISCCAPAASEPMPTQPDTDTGRRPAGSHACTQSASDNNNNNNSFRPGEQIRPASFVVFCLLRRRLK